MSFFPKPKIPIKEKLISKNIHILTAWYLRPTERVYHICTISGGKDSVTMADLLCKNGYPVDLIVFNNTLAEFPMMYEYIAKLKTYFKDRYNKDIQVLIPNKTPEAVMFRKVVDKNSEWYGWIKGVFAPVMGFCEWRTESKIRPLERFLKEREIRNYKIYIGYTLDEQDRVNREDTTKLYPLIDDFKMSERNCQEYLINQEMENPLYRFFTRTGCMWCPANSDKAWFTVWKHFPETWEYMKWVEKMLAYYISIGEKVIYKGWFPDGETCEDKEKKFKKADLQGSLFDFSDEPHKDCFCKV